MYTYGHQNPVRLSDPDGNAVEGVVALAGWVATGAVSGGIAAGAFNAAAQYASTGEVHWGGIGGVADAMGEGAQIGAVLGPVIGARAGAARGAAIATAEERANAIHSVLDPRAQRARTTAVTETQEGVRVVSSSERRLTPAQRAQLGANEVEGVGVGHAEATGINAAKGMGLTPTGTAASRPICTNCAQAMAREGVEPLSTLK